MSEAGEQLEPSPFATAGSIVESDGFVGRGVELRRLAVRTLGLNPASASVTGLPKVGKSSLVWNLLFGGRVRVPGHIVPVWLNLATSRDLREVLVGLAGRILEALPPGTAVSGDLTAVATDTSLDTHAVLTHTQRYLRSIRQGGLRVVAVLDEFDSAREVFGEHASAAFRVLRDLAYDPSWRLAWITVSRRSVRTIVNQSNATDSPFPNIFRRFELSCFTVAERIAMVELSSILAPAGLLPHIEVLTGGHPYLAAILLDSAHVIASGHQEVTDDGLLKEIAGEYREFYEDLVNLLRADDSFTTTVEIVFGPVRSATRHDAERLCQQGFLIHGTDEVYRTFSEHFRGYLGALARGVDLWPLWTRTERALRDMAREVLNEKLGPAWPTVLHTAVPPLAAAIRQWHEMLAREQQSFGSLAANDILDFTYPMELFQLAGYFWDDFRLRLGSQSRRYWEQRFQVLAQVRKPLAHSRTVDGALVLRAEGYCRELLELLDVPEPDPWMEGSSRAR